MSCTSPTPHARRTPYRDLGPSYTIKARTNQPAPKKLRPNVALLPRLPRDPNRDLRPARLQVGLRGGRVRGDVAARRAAEPGLRVRAVAPRRAHAPGDGVEERLRRRRAARLAHRRRPRLRGRHDPRLRHAADHAEPRLRRAHALDAAGLRHLEQPVHAARRHGELSCLRPTPAGPGERK